MSHYDRTIWWDAQRCVHPGMHLNIFLKNEPEKEKPKNKLHKITPIQQNQTKIVNTKIPSDAHSKGGNTSSELPKLSHTTS